MPAPYPVDQAVADAKVFHDQARALHEQAQTYERAGGPVPPELRERLTRAQERAGLSADEVLIALRRHG